jgi:hypothetical protein
MPTLFISYKRGTAGINPLRERLKAARYRTWYDQDDIHVGDDWQQSIDQGIDHSDAVIVGLTPGACDSPYVKYEVERAQEQNKLIFPVKLEALNEVIDLPKLNLSKTQFVDFTKAEPDAWNKALSRLLADMQRHKALQITRHTERARRGTAAHELHQRYLRTRIVEPLGRLQLSQIAATGSDGVPLEAVYVGSPTGLAISVEVQDWRVIDWWIDARFPKRDERNSEVHSAELTRQRPQDLGYEPAALEALISRIEQTIERYRSEYPDAKPDEKQS